MLFPVMFVANVCFWTPLRRLREAGGEGPLFNRPLQVCRRTINGFPCDQKNCSFEFHRHKEANGHRTGNCVPAVAAVSWHLRQRNCRNDAGCTEYSLVESVGIEGLSVPPLVDDEHARSHQPSGRKVVCNCCTVTGIDG